MHVRRIALLDYRNWAQLDLELSPGVTLFLGSNGQGKTNLVEAIAYFSQLGSHRTSQDAALVRHGHDRAIVRTLIGHAGRELVLDVEITASGANRARVAGTVVKHAELARHHAAVLFAPEDLSIVRGDPAGRRRFIDQLIVQLRPAAAGVIADYERVLRQRNSLLKSARTTRTPSSALGTLDIWDERLVTLGTRLIEARADTVDRLREPVTSAYRALTERDHAPTLGLAVTVAQDVDEQGAAAADAIGSTDAITKAFTTRLSEMRDRELERGVSLVGPHRDDLVLGLNGLPVRGYASHGESWSFALALRLGSAQLLRTVSTIGDPVLILDDVFAELDEERRHRLAGAVADFEQVLITAAVAADVPDDLHPRIVRIQSGEVLEQRDGAR